MAVEEPMVDALGNPISIGYLGTPVHLVRDDSGNPIMVDDSGTPVSLSMDGSGKPVLLDDSGNPVSVNDFGNPANANDLTNSLCSLLSPGDANALLGSVQHLLEAYRQKTPPVSDEGYAKGPGFTSRPFSIFCGLSQERHEP